MIFTLRTIIRRFFELFITNVLISAMLTELNMAEILNTPNTLLLGMLVGFAIFICINIYNLRRCFFDLRSRTLYYTINLAAALLFAGVCFAVQTYCPNEWFTWAFALTKFVRFTNTGLSSHQSAAIFHIACIASVFVAPIGLGWIFREDFYAFDENDFYLEN